MNFLNLIEKLSADEILKLDKHLSEKTVNDLGGTGEITLDTLISAVDENKLSACTMGQLVERVKSKKKRLEEDMQAEKEEKEYEEKLAKIRASKKFTNFAAKLKAFNKHIENFPTKFKTNLKLNLVFDAKLEKEDRLPCHELLEYGDYTLCEVVPISELHIKVDNSDKALTAEQVKAVQQALDENFSFDDACELAYNALPDLKGKVKDFAKELNSLHTDFKNFEVDYDEIEKILND